MNLLYDLYKLYTIGGDHERTRSRRRIFGLICEPTTGATAFGFWGWSCHACRLLLPPEVWACRINGPQPACPSTTLSLTGRWTAFHRRAGQLWGAPVSHEPWPLRAATASGHFTEPLRWVVLRRRIPTPTAIPVEINKEIHQPCSIR